MAQKRKLSKIFKRWTTFSIILFSVLITLVGMFFNNRMIKTNSKDLRDNFVAGQKDMLRNQVENAISIVHHERKKIRESAKKQVKREVENAFKISEIIYEKYNGRKSKAEIIEIIMEVLRPIRFNNGNGYLFSNYLNGLNLLYPVSPSIEGTNMINLTDVKGNFFVKEQNQICIEKGEGFVTSYVAKPNSNKKEGIEKISYIKYFEPYKLYFGAGVYRDEIEEKQKESVLDFLSKYRFGNQNYLFGSTYDGDALFSNGKVTRNGANIWNLTDPNGVKIIQEQRKVVENSEGGFISYHWNKLSTEELFPKVSFSKGIDDWEWMIGAGVYLDEIENVIKTRQDKHYKNGLKTSFTILLLTIFIVIIYKFIIYKMNQKMKSDYSHFQTFFDKAATSNDVIDISKLKYSEFVSLAKNANSMILDKREVEQKIINEKEKLIVTIRSIGDAVITTDKEGKVVLLNTVAENLTGWKIADAKGKKLSRVFHIINSTTREQVENPVKQVLQTGTIVGLANHTVLISKNDKEFQIADSAAPIRDSNKNVIGTVLVFRDVTQDYKLKEDLFQSERKYRKLFDESPTGIISVNTEGEITEVNNRMVEILNSPSVEATKKINFFKFPPLIKIGLSQKFRNCIETKESKIFQSTYESKWGSVGYYYVSLLPIFDKEENVEYVQANVIDITERVKGDEEIHKLSTIIETANQGVVIADLSGKITYVNPELLEIGDWDSKSDFINNSIFSFIKDEDKYRLENEIIPELLEVGQIKTEFDLLIKDNSFIPAEINGSVILDEKGNTQYLVAMFRDITERKRDLEKLKDSERTFKSVFNNLIGAIYIQDSNGLFIDVNESVLKMYGYKKSELIGNSSVMLAAPDKNNLEEITQKIEQAYKGQSQQFEFLGKRKDGSMFPNLVNLSVGNYFGKKVVIAYSMDISKQKENEIELQKMERLRSIGTLAGGIAHDFNNLLAGLYGNLSMMKLKTDVDNPQYKYLINAEKSMDRATKLTKQLLTFSKGGAPIKEDVELATVIKEIVNFDLSGSKVKPIFNIGKNLFNIKVDKGQMQQVFSNLTINANQASPKGGHLFVDMNNITIQDDEVTGLVGGNYIQITVQDEGSGIDEQHIKNIFDPYFTTKDTGNGLGLATTYSIVKKHGGHIEIESTIGVGSKFTIYLPASQSSDIVNEENDKPIEINLNRKAKILVMDDEYMIRTVASEMINLLGFEADVANGGVEAIQKYKNSLESKPFDIIIMDLTIPGGMGGEEAVKKIHEINSDAKVIVSSGYSSGGIMTNYKERGFVDMYEKPFTMDKLKEVIYRVLGI